MGLYFGSYDTGVDNSENVSQFVIPINCVISRLYIRTDGNVGTTNQGYTFTVRKNG